MKYAAATLGSGNLRLAVLLPEGEDLNEWVAVNSMYQFHRVLFLLLFPVLRGREACQSEYWSWGRILDQTTTLVL